MTDNKDIDIRWIQRLKHFKKALIQLNSAVDLYQQRELFDIEKQGLIKSFEFTHEIAWNVMKDFFAYQGNVNIMGSRDATREAFQYGLITDGETWMEMIKSRNQTSHTYNKDTADDISTKVVHFYVKLFNDFEKKMDTLQK